MSILVEKEDFVTIRIAELFAGVGGFRLGLDGYHDAAHPEFDMKPAGDFKTVWANQWEPNGQESKQFAWRCYEKRFGEGSCVNEDIAVVLQEVKDGKRSIPEFDMLVGGFPCQDYSVAKPLALASGIEVKKVCFGGASTSFLKCGTRNMCCWRMLTVC
mgnify:CR=1 FL=1